MPKWPFPSTHGPALRSIGQRAFRQPTPSILLNGNRGALRTRALPVIDLILIAVKAAELGVRGEEREQPARSLASVGRHQYLAGGVRAACARVHTPQVTVWALTQIEYYLYQFVHLIRFFAVFSKMRTPSLSKAFGSNQQRQSIIKIYDPHSDSGSHSRCSWNSLASSPKA